MWYVLEFPGKIACSVWYRKRAGRALHTCFLNQRILKFRKWTPYTVQPYWYKWTPYTAAYYARAAVLHPALWREKPSSPRMRTCAALGQRPCKAYTLDAKLSRGLEQPRTVCSLWVSLRSYPESGHFHVQRPNEPNVANHFSSRAARRDADGECVVCMRRKRTRYTAKPYCCWYKPLVI